MSNTKSIPITIRNTTRQKYYLYLKPADATMAREAKEDGIHAERDLLVIGDAQARVKQGEATPELHIPAWLWEAVRSFSEAQKAYVDAEVRNTNIVMSRAA